LGPAPAGGTHGAFLRQTTDAIFWFDEGRGLPDSQVPQLRKVAKDGSGAFAVPAPYDAAAAAIADGYVYVADPSSIARTAATGPGLAPLQKIADVSLGLGAHFVFAEADDDGLFVYPMSNGHVVTRVDLASGSAAEFARFDDDPDGALEIHLS